MDEGDWKPKQKGAGDPLLQRLRKFHDAPQQKAKSAQSPEEAPQQMVSDTTTDTSATVVFPMSEDGLIARILSDERIAGKKSRKRSPSRPKPGVSERTVGELLTERNRRDTTPRWKGGEFLRVYDLMHAENARGKSAKELGEQIDVPAHVISRFRGVPILSAHMRELVLAHNLSPEVASDIFRFPEPLWEKLTQAQVAGRLATTIDFPIVRYRHGQGEGTLRELFAQRGFGDWPDGVDDEGNSITG